MFLFFQYIDDSLRKVNLLDLPMETQAFVDDLVILFSETPAIQSAFNGLEADLAA